MSENQPQSVFIHLGGQDDNLGDSALRAAYFLAAQGPGRQFHIQLGAPRSSDYNSGLPLKPEHVVYPADSSWIDASKKAYRPVLLFHAGEVNAANGFPQRHNAIQIRRVLEHGGAVIMAGTGLKDPYVVTEDKFHPVMREMQLVSWRDKPSRDAAGFGDYAPDWAYSLGTSTEEWAPVDSRKLLAVSLRYDRPWPSETWINAVRDLAAQTATKLVTVVQVARDAPRAVKLAEVLGAQYLTPHSMRHIDLDSYVRDVYRQSLAVISDRAHGLIIGATEGAYPIGSAADPQKITRLLAAGGVGELVGHYDQLPEFAEQLPRRIPDFAPAIEGARDELRDLARRMDGVMKSIL